MKLNSLLNDLNYAKRLLTAPIRADPLDAAAVFLFAAKAARRDEQRAILLLLASLSYSYSPKPSAAVAEGIAKAVVRLRCDGEVCNAYKAAAASTAYNTAYNEMYEVAWRAFEKSGKYKPVVAPWLPVEDEADVARIEAEFSRVTPDAVRELFDVDFDKYVALFSRKLKIKAADFYFRAYLESGDERYLAIRPPESLLKGRILAFDGYYEDARRTFTHVMRLSEEWVASERAKIYIAMLDVFQRGRPFAVSSPLYEAEVAKLIADAYLGKKARYVEEKTVGDVLTNFAIDVAQGRTPPEYRLAILVDYTGYRWLFETVISAPRDEATRMLYFAIF